MATPPQRDDGRAGAAGPSTGTTVSQLMLGFMTTQLVGTALRLDLPDRIGDETRAADELAVETATHRTSLTRLLRALAGIGVTAEVEPGRFALTATGSRLRTGADGSLHAMARVFTDDSMTRGWHELTDCVRTGEPAFDRLVGTGYYAHLATDPGLSRLFHEAHGETTRRAAECVGRAYDFAGADTVVDVGGGDGTLLATVLAATPGPSGIVYDTETGVVDTLRTLEEYGVADRCEVRTGDFLTAVPPGADRYLIKSTLHNWDDAHATRILDSCRRAIAPGGRLLVIETVLPERVDPDAPPFAYLSDLNMLVNLGGRERTEAEFRELLGTAGFELVSSRPIPDAPNLGLSIVEAAPV